jgi:hypothetical protein
LVCLILFFLPLFFVIPFGFSSSLLRGKGAKKNVVFSLLHSSLLRGKGAKKNVVFSLLRFFAVTQQGSSEFLQLRYFSKNKVYSSSLLRFFAASLLRCFASSLLRFFAASQRRSEAARNKVLQRSNAKKEEASFLGCNFLQHKKAANLKSKIIEKQSFLKRAEIVYF